MRFPRYERYRDSEVRWLGPVPSDWDVKRIRHLFEIRKRICGSEGYTVLSITQQGIRAKDVESGDGQLSSDYSKYQFVEVGDFAMNHMDLLTGYVDISPLFGVTSPDYRVFAVRDKEVCHDRYCLYLLQMGYRNKVFFAFGQGSSQLGRWRFPTDEFMNFECPCPPIEEQRQIAAVLDHETAEIDALVAEQHRLIALLKEKRQAIISRAVTKGLNPDAPMKDSSVDWLGRVPAHWTIRPLKYLASFKSGGTPDKSRLEFWDGYVPWASAKDLKGDTLDDTEDHITDTALETGAAVLLQSPSLLVVVRGMILARTFPVVVANAPMAINQDLKAVVPKSGIRIEYLAWLFRGSEPAVLSNLDEAAHGTKALRMDRWGSMLLPVPPLGEQVEIAAHVEKTTAKIDALIAEAERAIALLQERRTALISAAVTGKIDVRGAATGAIA